MKKGIVFLFLLASPFLLTGCGDKDDDEESSSKTKLLTCKATVSGLDTTVKIEYDTKNSEIKSAKAKYIMDLSSYSDTQKDAIKDQDLCTSFDKKLATDCKTTYEDDSLVINVDLDIPNMIETEFNGKEKVTLDELKEGYEKNLKADCSVE